MWSVLLLYPEYGQSDIIQAFREEDRCVTVWHIRVLCCTDFMIF